MDISTRAAGEGDLKMLGLRMDGLPEHVNIGVIDGLAELRNRMIGAMSITAAAV